MCSKNRAHSAKALPHEIRRAQAHPARLQSAMGEIAGQKIVFAGGQLGGRASPRAMRVSESLAPRQADAVSFLQSRSRPEQGARWRQESHQGGPARKIPA
jgi:hypothetical protein